MCKACVEITEAILYNDIEYDVNTCIDTTTTSNKLDCAVATIVLVHKAAQLIYKLLTSLDYYHLLSNHH